MFGWHSINFRKFDVNENVLSPCAQLLPLLGVKNPPKPVKIYVRTYLAEYWTSDGANQKKIF